MQQLSIAEVLAESFWNNWISSDLSPDVLAALELCPQGVAAYEELRDLSSTWQQRFIDSRSLTAQASSLQYCLGLAEEQIKRVTPPEDLTVAQLLQAMAQSFRALVECCNAVIVALENYHDGALREAVESAEMASSVLKSIYDGTHKTPEEFGYEQEAL